MVASSTGHHSADFLTGGSTITIGTFDTNKAVKLTITPAQVEQAGFGTATAFRNSFATGCSGSSLSIPSTFSYYRFRESDTFTINGDRSYIKAVTNTTNADGTKSYVQQQFIYTKAAATISGTVSCSGYNISVNLSLQPGWNIAQESYNYNPVTGAVSNKVLTLVSNSNSYTGPWAVYDDN